MQTPHTRAVEGMDVSYRADQGSGRDHPHAGDCQQSLSERVAPGECTKVPVNLPDPDVEFSDLLEHGLERGGKKRRSDLEGIT